MTPVPTLDLQRYSGTWYEIARLPNPFQQRLPATP
jgi:lipocalin